LHIGARCANFQTRKINYWRGGIGMELKMSVEAAKTRALELMRRGYH
jgi:hypothetical protein